MVRMGHEKPGKSWSLQDRFSDLKSRGILICFLESENAVRKINTK